MLRKVLFIISILLNLYNLSPAQPTEKSSIVEIESRPEYPGGLEAFTRFISKNLKYPLYAQNIGIQGRVVVRFVINQDGSLSNIEVIKGIGGDCDEEARRVISQSSPWIPGKQRGKPVKSRMMVPITFKSNTKALSDYLVVIDGQMQGTIQEKMEYLKSLKKENRASTQFLKPKEAQAKFGKKLKRGALIIELKK